MKEVFQQLRKYEIEIRKAVDNRMQGNFHSIFKGAGLEFDDVRSYQYGDDIRSIDWNVSSKGHGLFVKRFKEDKEQTVFFIVDVSASQQIKSHGRSKWEVAREVTGVLSLSAVKEGGQVGLYAFSDKKEKYLRPARGMKAAWQLISYLYQTPQATGLTSISQALLSVLNIVKRKSVMIVVSDFIDSGYESLLKSMANRHDLVLIHLYDPQEGALPQMGIIPVIDPETGQTRWVNTSLGAFRQTHAKILADRSQWLDEFCLKHQVVSAHLDCTQDYIPELIKLFRVRNYSGKTPM